MPGTTFRLNAPFSQEEAIWVVTEYVRLRSVAAVRRKYGYKFMKKNNMPSHNPFKRLIDRFQSTGSIHPSKPRGQALDKRNELTEKVKEVVKPFQERKQSISVSKVAETVKTSKTTVWRIMRKTLRWKPYKPNVTVPLTDAHMAGRRNFCQWLLEQPEGFPDQVIWTDEKWFVLHPASNKQNERYVLGT